MLRSYLRMALVVAMVTPKGVQIDEEGDKEQQCLLTVVAPLESSWQQLSGGPWRVSLRRLLWLEKQHNLKLQEGRPPPHTAEPHLLITTCRTGYKMWATLSHQAVSNDALEDDSYSIECIIERIEEFFLVLFGRLPRSAEQMDGTPPRTFMVNYCGRDLPVQRKPVGGKRMYKETLRLEKELMALP